MVGLSSIFSYFFSKSCASHATQKSAGVRAPPLLRMLVAALRRSHARATHPRRPPQPHAPLTLVTAARRSRSSAALRTECARRLTRADRRYPARRRHSPQLPAHRMWPPKPTGAAAASRDRGCPLQLPSRPRLLRAPTIVAAPLAGYRCPMCHVVGGGGSGCSNRMSGRTAPGDSGPHLADVPQSDSAAMPIVCSADAD